MHQGRVAVAKRHFGRLRTPNVRIEYLPAAGVSGPSDELLRFIGSSFRSVWALELVLTLKGDKRLWTHDELVSTMRASELVVSKACDALVAAGLASVEGHGVIYMPINDEVAALIDQVEALYAVRPDAVRRAIVSSISSGACAFADAFKLRKD